jgi:sulfate permease, SulP family
MNLSEIKREFQPNVLLSSISAGIIVTLIDISIEISLAALIFSGNLSQFLPRGIGLMLFGAMAIGIVTAVTTSLPGIVALPQDTPAAIFALITAAIAVAMKNSPPTALYATSLAAIVITSLLTAVFFLLLGWFKASVFVRYIPYPVVGGFLAGTGWLLCKGAFSVMVNVPLNLKSLPQWFTTNNLAAWVPGILFAVALLFILRRFDHFLIMPGALLLAMVLFYGWLAVTHVSAADALNHGWLLGPLPASALYQPLTFSMIAQVNWIPILQNSDKIASITILSVIAMLLNVSGLEVTDKQDIDLNRELLTAGWANFVGGLGGSPVGYQTLSLSALTHRLGARSRLVNLVIALLCGTVLLFGASLISYFPKLVLGGMLFFLGLTFMVEWLVDAYKHLPLIDYLLVWAILIIIAIFGFLPGIIVGSFAAAMIFVFNYSRINAIKNILNGELYHSKVDRPRVHRDILSRKGSQIYVLRLQGFIFFGSIQTILERVKQRLDEKNQQPLKFILLDFQRVTRLDSSAVFGIIRLKQLMQSNSVQMVWTNVAHPIRRQLERGGLVDEADDSFIILPSLDHGVEWCENRILAHEGINDLTGFIERMEGQLKRVFPELQAVDRLMKYLERREVKEGEYLMRQGDPPTEMYFVESGLITAQIEFPDGQILRLRSIRGGATVGEMGLYLESTRTASVVAARPSSVYRLSARALKEMRENDPEVAALLHEWIARLLAERLADNNRTIEALLD